MDEIDIRYRKELNDYRKIDSNMPTPLMMGFYDLLANKKINSNIFSSLLKIVNSYIIRRALCSLDTSSITRIFPNILKDVIEDCKNEYSKIEFLLKKYLINNNQGKSAYMPDDNEFKEHLLKDNMYILRQYLRIVLEKLENENNSAPVDLSSLSIEHIMPQNSAKWINDLNISEEEYINYVNKLGNLTLVSKIDNSKASNNTWETKKELFKITKHLKLNSELLSKNKWDIEEIKIRTNLLADWIIRLYPSYFLLPDSLNRISIHINNVAK